MRKKQIRIYTISGNKLINTAILPHKDSYEHVDDYLQDVASWVATSKLAYTAMHTLQMKKAIADTKRLAAILHDCEESVVCRTAREVTPQLVK